MRTFLIFAVLPTAAVRRRFAFTLLSAFMVLALGCGGPRVIPVKGVVTYNGEPLKSGTVVFSPEEPSARSATATIGADGKFTPTSITANDGLMVGKFKVSVTSYVVDIASTPPIKLAKLKDGGSAIPRKYADFGTSGLTVTIAPGDSSKDITFDLKD